jgi:ribosomal protein S20
MSRRDLAGRLFLSLVFVGGMAACVHDARKRNSEREQLQAALDSARETYRTACREVVGEMTDDHVAACQRMMREMARLADQIAR